MKKIIPPLFVVLFSLLPGLGGEATPASAHPIHGKWKLTQVNGEEVDQQLFIELTPNGKFRNWPQQLAAGLREDESEVFHCRYRIDEATLKLLFEENDPIILPFKIENNILTLEHDASDKTVTFEKVIQMN